MITLAAISAYSTTEDDSWMESNDDSQVKCQVKKNWKMHATVLNGKIILDQMNEEVTNNNNDDDNNDDEGTNEEEDNWNESYRDAGERAGESGNVLNVVTYDL